MLFKTPSLEKKEQAVIDQIDSLRVELRGQFAVRRRWVGSLRRLTFARNIQGSNSIEGYNASLDDVAAVVDGQTPLDADSETEHALEGYRNAMTYVLQLAEDPHFQFDETLIRSLHFMMMSYDLTKNPGKWRPGFVYVRNQSSGSVVYEGPDAELVPSLMSEFVHTVSSQDKDVPVVVRAAMAHLNLVLIHPFSDGNGRMARCVQTLVLARESIVSSEFASIEEYLGNNTPDYYDVLAKTAQGKWQPERSARKWLRFCLTAHLRQALTLKQRVREAEEIWFECEELAKSLKLADRTIDGLFVAAQGHRLWRQQYQALGEETISEAIATRDLRAMTEAGLLMAKGEKRGRTYIGSQKLQAIARDVRERQPPLHNVKPFD